MKWISVEDRLPEEGQRVIYYFKITGIDIGRFTRKPFDDLPDDCQGNCFYGSDGWLTDDVTHWMPLPEKPK